MTTEAIVSIVTSAGLVGLLTTIINNVANRRRLGADITRIATDAAGGVIKRLETENKRVDEDNRDLRERIVALEERYREDRREWAQEQADWRATLARHAEWDDIAIKRLNEIDTQVMDDPPVLYPLTHVAW